METFSCDIKIAEDLTKKLYELQKLGEYCDYELTTQDGGAFMVHKWVLSTVSPFFSKLLDENLRFSERNSDTFLVRQVSSSILENIIQYMYTGEMKISSDTAKEIVDIALFLNLYTLVRYAIHTLSESVNEYNCLDLLRYSETCLEYGEKLTEKALKLVRSKIKDFMKTPDFLKLSSDTMDMLIAHEETTEDLYLAVREWLTYDLTNREQFVEMLMNKIQFEKLSRVFAKRYVFDNNPLMKTQSFNKMVCNLIINNWTQLKYSAKVNKSLYAIHGNEVLLYDDETNQFSETITKIEKQLDGFGYTTFDKKNIFVCGGQIGNKSVSACKYFSVERNEWKVLPSMGYERCYPSSIALDNKIYVCGGYSSIFKVTKRVEVFDTNKSTWSNLNDICDQKSMIGKVCHLNNCLYYISAQCVQRLDTRQSNWETLCEVEKPYGISSIEAYDNLIYGFNNKLILKFDIRMNEWLKNFQPIGKRSISYPRTCIKNGRIYILGGLKKNDHGEYELQIRNLPDLSSYDIKYGIFKNIGDCQALIAL